MPPINNTNKDLIRKKIFEILLQYLKDDADFKISINQVAKEFGAKYIDYILSLEHECESICYVYFRRNYDVLENCIKVGILSRSHALSKGKELSEVKNNKLLQIALSFKEISKQFKK